ncbi:hypothetical protein [Planctellipticum variicoloris]|uniref:hypothetical protein n=1 Tax=Planctellipticum variicoloris TaxID=3064265 RepID=UPI003013D97F|nr:hypothetical protein SH412_000671 [Planctomycetaceae bacterium SH412]
MMRQFWLVAVLVLGVSPSFADEPVAGPRIRVYNVADLVADEAVRAAPPALGHRHEESLNREHPETLASLEQLARLIETVVPSEQGAIVARPETLSLVVRRTPEEHAEIENLFEELRRDARPSLELTSTMFTEGSQSDPKSQLAAEELVKLIHSQFSAGPGLSPADVERARELIGQTKAIAISQPTLRLRSGVKSTLGTYPVSMSVTAVADPDGEHVRLRIDAPVNEAVEGKFPCQTMIAETRVGQSFLGILQFDGSGMFYLVTVRRPGTDIPATNDGATALK